MSEKWYRAVGFYSDGTMYESGPVPSESIAADCCREMGARFDYAYEVEPPRAALKQAQGE